MVLNNFITLEPDTPAVLHITGGEIVQRPIKDPLTNQAKLVNILELDVNELNGHAVSAKWGITSEKLAQQIKPLLDSGRIDTFNVIVTERGSSFQKEFEVSTVPR